MRSEHSPTPDQPSHTPTPKGQIIGAWACQLVAAGIFAMAAIPKLTGADDAVALFTTLGVEPWGRIATGVIEAAIVVLLLIPRLAIVGAALGVGVMAGAIMSHLTKLGINEGFYMALVVLAACLGVIALRRSQALALLARLRG